MSSSPSSNRSALVAFFLLSIILPVVHAHMQMSWPYPLHSTFNPDTPEDIKDYTLTAPLSLDGLQYPCKGYINNPASSPAMDSVVTYSAGQTYNVTIAGTAVHGGGSCQWSLSYDEGETWNVIQSYMGGCMTDSLTYDVTIPTEAPSGTAIFAWTWFNQLGNREMYSNCAVATITGGGSGLTGPTPFVANAGVNECITVENIDVVFPDPGSVVVYGGGYASSKPTTPAGYTGSNCVGPSASSSGSEGSAAASVGTSSATKASVAPTSSASTTTAAAALMPIIAAAAASLSASSSLMVAQAKHSASLSSVSRHIALASSSSTTSSSTTTTVAKASAQTIDAVGQATSALTVVSDALTDAAVASTSTASANSALPTPYIRFSCATSTSFWDGLEGEVKTECAAGTVCLYCGTVTGSPCVFPGTTCDASTSADQERRAIAKEAGAISRDRQRRRRRMIGKSRH